MMAVSIRRWILALLSMTGGLLHSQALLPDVQERVLKNGVRVLMVERPGVGAVHARLFVRGGRSETGGLAPVAADLLVRGLAAPPLPEGTKGIEELLKQEEGSFEAIRLERIQRQRHGVSESSSEMQGLEAIQKESIDRLTKLEAEAIRQDSCSRLGASGRVVLAEADNITWGWDLPKANLEAWCTQQAQALKQISLPWLPLERDRLIREYSGDQRSLPLSVLLGTALGGGVYARVLDIQTPGIEALGWTDMVTYANRVVIPARTMLVLVGDFSSAEIQPCLERTLGTWKGASSDPLRQERPLVELEGGTGARRLQANTLRDRRLLMAWRIPPVAHPVTPLLKVLGELLGGGSSSRLARRLMGSQPLAQSVRVLTGTPGGRETSLLVVEVIPAAEHPLSELEQAVLSEVMKLQQGAILQDEVQRAQREVEASEVMIQEDASRLAGILGAAYCQGGDWHLAFRGLVLNRDLTIEEIRNVAQHYLVPTQATTALLEPDPLLSPEDRQEARLVTLLKRVLEPRVSDPAQLESVARETLRQLRMVPAGDRDRIIKLLEAQVKP